MNGKTAPAERITPAEALQLFDFATAKEIYIARELYTAYKEIHETHFNLADANAEELYKLCELLSFVYDTGRVQGIREERAKKRGATV